MKTFIILLLTFLFLGCQKTSDKYDLVGSDSNYSGIRDDVEMVLNSEYEGKKRQVARQYAQSTQKIMDAANNGPIDTSQAKRINRDITAALVCANKVFQDEKGASYNEMTEKIKEATINTQERTEAYLKYNSLLDGTSWTLPNEDTCNF